MYIQYDASIIIPVNSSKILFSNFLTNLFMYKNITNYEIILISDDNDYELSVQKFKELENHNVKTINLKTKRGYSQVNNIACEHATSENLIFMNDDIILSANCLEILVNDINEGEADAVQPKLIYPQNNTIQSTGHVFTSCTNGHAFEGRDADAQIVNMSSDRTALTTALCCTTKDLFMKFGGFDIAYVNAWEGMEFTLKLTLNGYRCLYDNRAVAYHLRGGARNNYALDQSAQSAIFWSRWSNKLSNELLDHYASQLKTLDYAKSYILLNFSRLSNIEDHFANKQLRINNFINYTYISGQNSVDFFRTLPLGFTKIRQNVIYFCNNFVQVKNNLLWFKMRDKDDIILDLCGNAMHISDLPNSRV